MVLLSDLLHVALNVSPGISSHGAAASRSALVGHDAKTLPAFANDIVRLHDTVKRARGVVEDRDATVQVPQSELLDILSKLNSLEQQVAALLPAGTKDDKKPDTGDQNCDVEHLLFSLGVNGPDNKPGQVSDHPLFRRNANCSMEAIAAAQKQGQHDPLKSSGATPHKDDSSSSSPSKENKAAHRASPHKENIGSPSGPQTAPAVAATGDSAPMISVDSSEDKATESAAVGSATPATILDDSVALVSPTLLSAAAARDSVPTPPATLSGATGDAESTSTDPITSYLNEEFQTTTVTKTKTTRTTITITRKHTATHPRTIPTELPNETKFEDDDRAKPARASNGTKGADKGAGESSLPSGDVKMPPSSMNAPVSVGPKHFFNSTVKEFKARINDEPRLSTVLTETSTLVRSEATPALTSEKPSQLSNAGGAAKPSMANAPPSGFKTISTSASKGAAETKQ
ncbi:Uncharacterized protein TPAR_02816 [Tolypocladium paradoxum]|uniref:Uncharacterized protein n=1 Tax=Tolypocladium paradoxum TaxID=94208 RepID=A0A2S4L3I3_9HYPO|nr:Uncharacterized protein TPAR_02816 [Tolypocladium paradoxum]